MIKARTANAIFRKEQTFWSEPFKESSMAELLTELNLKGWNITLTGDDGEYQPPQPTVQFSVFLMVLRMTG